ncbi:MAG: Uma2 family endonuclease [Lachnospiraceae bacterium]|nr:Uma2 family endonuclease [Lachnospiraceae bacterium]
MALPQRLTHTIDDIYALPGGQRAELIDGQIYMMAPPNTDHQRISHLLEWEFAVFLNKDTHNYLEPDISVICDKNKLDEKGCNGAPDWIIEITSPTDPQRDYGVKLFKYRTAGVREYWIVNPQKNTITVFDFEKETQSNQYSWDDDIPVCIYGYFILNINKLLQQ